MLRLEQLAELIDKHRNEASVRVQEFTLGGRAFAFNSQSAIMGVINFSSDSWYRESVCLSAKAAIQRAHVLAAQGADIIDVGAESTLAHAARVDEGGQQTKLLPVVRALRDANLLVSVETYQLEVTQSCLETGATVLNLPGTERTDEIFRMVEENDATVILCFVQGDNVRNVGDFTFDGDTTAMMYEYFAQQIEAATRNGVKKIFIDPGLGFYYRNLQDSAVRVRHQMKTFLNTFRLRALG